LSRASAIAIPALCSVPRHATRSQATAAIDDVPLKGKAKMSNDPLFEMMRFNILTFALTEAGKKKLDDAYVSAWANGVYPVLHDGADWHKPFADNFRANKEMMESLVNDLGERWRDKKVPTYYELESELYGSKWKQSTLIDACTYLCLQKLVFDDYFRSALLKDRPSNASSMAGPFDRDRDLFQM
jgi:hypothetical protein